MGHYVYARDINEERLQNNLEDAPNLGTYGSVATSLMCAVENVDTAELHVGLLHDAFHGEELKLVSLERCTAGTGSNRRPGVRAVLALGDELVDIAFTARKNMPKVKGEDNRSNRPHKK